MQNHPMLFSHINKGAMKVASLCCNCTRDIKRERIFWVPCLYGWWPASPTIKPAISSFLETYELVVVLHWFLRIIEVQDYFSCAMASKQLENVIKHTYCLSYCIHIVNLAWTLLKCSAAMNLRGWSCWHSGLRHKLWLWISSHSFR